MSQEWEWQRVKEEWEEETDGQQESGAHVKEEPEWTGDGDWSLDRGVKEESGLLDLYVGHKVEGDLVLGPEGPQLPDSAFAQPTYARSPRPGAAAAGRPTGRDEPRASGEQRPPQYKPYSCAVCLKQFLYPSLLRVHRRIHTGETPYPCDVCPKQFTRLNALNTHRQIHTDEKPYSCDVCLKQFRRKGSLKTHRRTHAREDPYCDGCKAELH